MLKDIKNKILQGDCLDVLKTLEDNSIDSIVTDPPYGLSFMGKKWDYDVPEVDIWKEAFRVLKPGGHLLSFAGTRTYHRMAVNVEDAGFDIRDMISWLYGSGFPKSLNIGKQIDKIQGNEREDLGFDKTRHRIVKNHNQKCYSHFRQKDADNKARITKGNSKYEGWGTALKPACEPIVVARKPLSEKNVALNVLKYGTGGINIDESRIGTDMIKCSNDIRAMQKWKEQDGRKHKELINPAPTYNQGRFPANIILDEEAGKMLDEQSGISKSSKGKERQSGNTKMFGGGHTGDWNEYTDKGGASRFFYCAKASKSERNAELDSANVPMNRSANPQKNHHPTVKPIKLMEYLVRLVTPKGGVCLDPFIGSGTTAIACKRLGFKYLGIEREEDYIKIANARLSAIKDYQSNI
jgi:DNA modification methylase